ncbi:hypothetical protein HanXRQr2_Chr08g0331401 [Helianthus annuus]|uniref:Uncharacterized protein n=1 Tax=Helianthus annuus TaxID=4232 RepID=A0A9K3ID63_HELAN|nr:hypothetical protein HanXRQr2_Chr08g0331401 [Helianthus annuus]KAJ0901016.1 hypothetical protein HanPSC8_Chr08g0320411 [Helianthus annuus]
MEFDHKKFWGRTNDSNLIYVAKRAFGRIGEKIRSKNICVAKRAFGRIGETQETQVASNHFPYFKAQETSIKCSLSMTKK